MSAIEEVAKDVIVDDIDSPGPPISVPDSGDAGEGGKLKMIIALVKKSLGVKDIAAMLELIFDVQISGLTVILGDFRYQPRYSSLFQTLSTGIISIDRIYLQRGYPTLCHFTPAYHPHSELMTLTTPLNGCSLFLDLHLPKTLNS